MPVTTVTMMVLLGVRTVTKARQKGIIGRSFCFYMCMCLSEELTKASQKYHIRPICPVLVTVNGVSLSQTKPLSCNGNEPMTVQLQFWSVMVYNIYPCGKKLILEKKVKLYLKLYQIMFT